MEAAAAGCHIIAEKPLALDMPTLEKVRKSVERNKINLMAMLTMRSDPQFVAAREVYQAGYIGQAVLINARKSYKWGTRPQWFGEKDKYGGTIGWIGIHAFDFINYITDLNFSRVAAMKGNFAHSLRPDCEDNCVIIAELSNGAHATISADLCRPENAPTHGDDWIRIACTKGVLEASGSKKECSVISNDKGVFQQPLPNEKDKIFRRFLLNIIAGKSNDEIKDLSFMLTKICLIARDAAEKNKVFEIV
jgi:predicted dehydrogenase